MKIIIVSATDFEMNEAKEVISNSNLQNEILFTATSVGMLATAVSLMDIMFQQKPGLIVQAGIAGTFDENLFEKTVLVKKEILGDMGVFENNNWQDIFDLKLENKDTFPFKNGSLSNDEIDKWNLLNLPTVTGITVNEISTDGEKIDHLKQKYNPSIESMEGAALHFACKKFNTSFVQIRSISNMIGERDKTKWRMKNAIENLNKTLIQYCEKLGEIN